MYVFSVPSAMASPGQASYLAARVFEPRGHPARPAATIDEIIGQRCELTSASLMEENPVAQNHARPAALDRGDKNADRISRLRAGRPA
jgi:hypothetical protein